MRHQGFDIEGLLDERGWRIVEELQKDARLSMAELGRRVNLSAPATAERVRRLEDVGVIEGYRALINVSKVGLPILAFIRITAHGDVKSRVSALVRDVPEVLECYRGTGSDCFIIKMAVSSIAHLEKVTDRFTSFGQLTTSIVLSSPLQGRIVSQPREGREGEKVRGSRQTTAGTRRSLTSEEEKGPSRHKAPPKACLD